jgi:hypothetical protein
MLQWVGVGIVRRVKCHVLANGSIGVSSTTYLFGWDSKRGMS